MLQLFCCEESLQYMIRNGLHPLFCDLTACTSCYALRTHLQDQLEGNLQLIADVLSQNMSEVYISRNKLQVNKTFTKLFYQNYDKIPNNNLIIKNPLNNVKLNNTSLNTALLSVYDPLDPSQLCFTMELSITTTSTVDCMPLFWLKNGENTLVHHYLTLCYMPSRSRP